MEVLKIGENLGIKAVCSRNLDINISFYLATHFAK